MTAMVGWVVCLIKEGPSFAQFLARFEPTNQFQQQNNNNGWVGGMLDERRSKLYTILSKI
jgi:hypothetical protein